MQGTVDHGQPGLDAIGDAAVAGAGAGEGAVAHGHRHKAAILVAIGADENAAAITAGAVA